MTEAMSTDVVVVGAGSAGCAAAIASGRHGAKTVLVDRNTFLGGTSTAVLDTFYALYTSGDSPLQIVRGVAQEVVDALERRGACYRRQNTFGSGLGVTYSPETLMVVWDELMAEAGVRVLTGALAFSANEGARGVEIEVAAKGGPFKVRAQVAIDASGDGDIAVLAGAKPLHDDELCQPATMTFRLANVDTERAFPKPKAGRRPLRDYIEEASALGYELPGTSGSMHRTVVPGCVLVSMTRVEPPAPDDPESYRAAEVKARSQVEECARFLRDRVPGFEQSALIGVAPMLGVRETRRVEGAHVLSEQEVLTPSVPPDAVALCGAPIEDLAHEVTRWQHVPPPGAYGIPLGCLQPAGLQRMLVAGRCFSADHGAHSSARSMGTCMALGHAAGVAASIAVSERGPVAEVPALEVRAGLLSDGAVLEVGQ